MYKLYSVGDRAEPCGTPACMYLGIDISPSIETMWTGPVIFQFPQFHSFNPLLEMYVGCRK
jgi:hypothetical protein